MALRIKKLYINPLLIGVKHNKLQPGLGTSLCFS
jgi:hypothetical protein